MARRNIASTSVTSVVREQLNGNFEELYDDTSGLETNKVPYTGATGTVDLGLQKLITTEIEAVNDLRIDCGTEKTLVLEEVVWDDLRIVPSTFDFPGVSDPTLVAYQPGGSGVTFQVYEFQKGDYAYFSCQVPHGYKEGADIKFHIHWTPGTRGNEEAGKAVAWGIDYSWCNVTGTFAASAALDLTDTVTGTDHYHEITPDVSATGTGKTISSMLLCRIIRNNVAGDTWVGTASGQLPILLEVDIHIPHDTVGSRTSLTK